MPDSFWVPPRVDGDELIDLPDTPWEEVLRGMRDIQRINRLLASYAFLIGWMSRHATWPAERPLRILDVGTGLADKPRAIVRWARARGRRVEVVGLDLNPRILSMAEETLGHYPEIRLVEADALAMPFEAASFDWAMCHLALHHFPLDTHDRFFAELDRVIRPGGGLIVGDLARSRLNLALARPFLRVFTSPVARHDGMVSIRRSLSAREVDGLIDRTGLTYLARRWPAPLTQYLVAGVKPGAYP